MVPEHINKAAIQDNLDFLEEYWNDVLPVPNTHKLHHVRALDYSCVFVAETSV